MIQKTLLLAFSLAISIGLAECASRLVLDPIDMLQPTMAEHDALNHRIEGGSGGHDERGFRNYSTPEQADIIAIGDSMTYGVAATAGMAWPKQLERQLDTPVYSMALGGYGPLQYLHLLQTQAREMKPTQVIIALYIGNDIMDAYNLVYGREHWAQYRNADIDDEVDTSRLVEMPSKNSEKRFAALRNFLSRNSVLYSIVTRSVIGDLVRSTEAQKLGDRLVEIPTAGATTYLDVQKYAAGVTLSDPRIAEGLHLTEAAIGQWAQTAEEQSIDLYVLVIPTKIDVYADTWASHLAEDQVRQLQALRNYELQIRRTLIERVAALGLRIIDPREALISAARSQDIYPLNDNHPNGIGYGVIANIVANALSGAE